MGLLLSSSIAVISMAIPLFPEFSPSSSSVAKQPERRVFTLVLNYHPLLMRAGLAGIARGVLDSYRYEIENILGANVAVRIAWKKRGPHMAHKLRAIGRINNNTPAP